MLYKNAKEILRLPDGDTYFFDIVTGVLQRGILASFLFIIYLDYVLQTSTHFWKDNDFTLWKR